jgi:hypothetical protein
MPLLLQWHFYVMIFSNSVHRLLRRTLVRSEHIQPFSIPQRTLRKAQRIVKALRLFASL